jgi:gluconate 2-dehydrogenase gamma chain
MTLGPPSRRDFVGAMATGVAATWLSGAWSDRLKFGVGEPGPVSTARALRADQARDLEALTSLIIPTDETAGAREAHVVDFINRGLASFASDQRPLFDQGLTDLNARVSAQHSGPATFADLGVEDQTALLHALEAEHSEFFDAVRIATVTGFLANPEYGGNADKLGWRLIGFEDRFAWQSPFGYYDSDASRSE